MSEALWSLERKCSEAVVGLERFVCLSNGLRCLLKRSLSRRFVSPMYCLWQRLQVYHVNNVFRVAVYMMSDMSRFAGRMKCVTGTSFCYVVACQTVLST